MRVMSAQHGGATASGPASGSGYEIILQGFNWESHRQPWYKVRPTTSCFKAAPSGQVCSLAQIWVVFEHNYACRYSGRGCQRS